MGDSAQEIRAFVAVKMAPAIDAALIAFQAEWRQLDLRASWITPGNFHLTLCFLGDHVSPASLQALSEGLHELASRTPPFTIEARGAGAFPSARQPRIIWAGLDGAELAPLAEAIGRLAAAAGVQVQLRPFSPHLTLGRLRIPRGLDEVRAKLAADAKRSFGSSPVRQLILFESRLSQKNATHLVRGIFELGRPADSKF